MIEMRVSGDYSEPFDKIARRERGALNALLHSRRFLGYESERGLVATEKVEASDRDGRHAE